jgi:CheY-like chemotaxis protein
MDRLPVQTYAILVVDDDPAILEMLVELLLDEGFTVYSAANGQQALARALEVPLDLILTDLMMPLVDGHALLRSLREHPQTARVPVLLMSAAGHARPDDPFDAFIAKPFSIDDLLAQLQQLLS